MTRNQLLDEKEAGRLSLGEEEGMQERGMALFGQRDIEQEDQDIDQELLDLVADSDTGRFLT